MLLVLIQGKLYSIFVIVVVQSLSHFRVFATPMDCSTPGSSVLHNLLEFAQIHVHWVGEAIQPSHPLSAPSPPALNLSPYQVFSNESTLHIRWPKVLEFQLQHVLPMNIQGWFPLGWTGWISWLSKELSESSPTPQFESINPLVLSLLYGPTLTSKAME